MVHGGARDRAAGEADDEDPSFPRDAFPRTVEHFATDRVVDDVSAATIGCLIDDGHEIVVAIVDADLGSESKAPGDLVGPAGRRDDSGTSGYAQLDGG